MAIVGSRDVRIHQAEDKDNFIVSHSPLKFSVSRKCPLCNGGAGVGTRAVEFPGTNVGVVMCVIMLQRPGLPERSRSLVMADHERCMYGVEGDDRGLQEARTRLVFLNFWID